jgi:hypothetical protein
MGAELNEMPDSERGSAPSKPSALQGLMQGGDLQLKLEGYSPHRTAAEYYDDKGHLKPGATPDKIGYKPQPVAFVAHNRVEALMAAVAAEESGGHIVGRIDYGAKGPLTHHGTRAIGGWQMMEENIPKWAEEAGFKGITAKDLLERGPDGKITQRAMQLQHDIVSHQFEKLLKQGYSEADVASIWFTGHPVRGHDLASDGYTSANQYVANVQRFLQQVKVDPSTTMDAHSLPYRDLKSGSPDVPDGHGAPQVKTANTNTTKPDAGKSLSGSMLT